MSEREFLGAQRYCKVCRKQFHLTDGWVYKRKHNDTTVVFCSWKCLRAYEKTHQDVTPAELRRMVAQAVRDGLTTNEICTLLGCSTSMVAYWRHKVEEEKGGKDNEKGNSAGPGAADGDGHSGSGHGLDNVPAAQPGQHTGEGFGEK